MYSYFTLSNGLRVVCQTVSAKVDYFGVAINAGSRDEAPGRFGLAHFVEHTIFKGTLRRHAAHIIKRMESVGGELNAYTTKEETVVYSVFPHGNLARAAELVADLVVNSQFPAAELAREREVVRDEIDSYLDVPSEAVFDDFEDIVFAGSQLGHNILGESANLDAFTPEVCRAYIASTYTASRMVAFYRGGMGAERLRGVLERCFAALPAEGTAPERVAPPVVAPASHIKRIDSHQAHCVMGVRVPSMFSPERYPLGLITNILGGPGMNSRLNVALRERRGLVYSVDAGLTGWTDCGLFTVYFGCDPEDAPRCADLVRRELLRMSVEPLTARQLQAARQQYLGQLVVASDNHDQTALNAARATLFYGRVLPDAEFRARLESITPDELAHAARLLHPDLLTTLTMG